MLRDLDHDVVEQYLSEGGSNLKPRPSFSFPVSATPELLPPDGDFFVRLNVQSHLVVNTDSDAASVELRCAGRRYRFPRSMRSIIEQLRDGGRMIIPVGALEDQQLYLLQKRGAKVEQKAVLPVRFPVPMTATDGAAGRWERSGGVKEKSAPM